MKINSVTNGKYNIETEETVVTKVNIDYTEQEITDRIAVLTKRITAQQTIVDSIQAEKDNLLAIQTLINDSK